MKKLLFIISILITYSNFSTAQNLDLGIDKFEDLPIEIQQVITDVLLEPNPRIKLKESVQLDEFEGYNNIDAEYKLKYNDSSVVGKLIIKPVEALNIRESQQKEFSIKIKAIAICTPHPGHDQAHSCELDEMEQFTERYKCKGWYIQYY